MSYTLYRLHWKITKPHGCSIPEHMDHTELYSFHLSSEEAGEFIRQIAEQSRQGETKHTTVGAGKEIRTHDGILYHQVKLASDKDKAGVWGAPGQDGIHHHDAELIA